MTGAMVWTLFGWCLPTFSRLQSRTRVARLTTLTSTDYYGEPSFGGWPHVSSTFGSFDLAGFAKPAVWWYKSFWLLQVPDTSNDKPFITAGNHTVRIVENWDPSTTPIYPSNTTEVSPCSSLNTQHITFTGSGSDSTGQLKDDFGMCADVSLCHNATSGECHPVKFLPCAPNNPGQQWTFTELSQFQNAFADGCLNVWNSGAGPDVGLWECTNGGAPNDMWNRTAHGFKTRASSSEGDRCLTNGFGTQGSVMDVHVYSDLPEVELFVNGVSSGKQSIINPGLTPTATQQSWAVYPKINFVPGSLKAVGYDGTGASVATHEVFTSGAAASITLTLDAPSPLTGTGAALLLDGQDVGLVRAQISDAAGRLITTATHNVTFTIESGPGRVVGTFPLYCGRESHDFSALAH